MTHRGGTPGGEMKRTSDTQGQGQTRQGGHPGWRDEKDQ